MKKNTSYILFTVATLALIILTYIPILAVGETLPIEVSDLFRRGSQAMDHKEWEKAEELIREASEQWPECGNQVRIPGTFTKRFLPHYFLGLVLYEQGRCPEALAEWEESEVNGCIQKYKKDYGKLQRIRAKCEEKQ